MFSQMHIPCHRHTKQYLSKGKTKRCKSSVRTHEAYFGHKQRTPKEDFMNTHKLIARRLDSTRLDSTRHDDSGRGYGDA